MSSIEPGFFRSCVLGVFGKLFIDRSLFCFVVMRSIEPGFFRSCLLGVFGKLSMRRGVWTWFHDVCTCGAKVIEY
jgi:hypothetical protein